MRIARAAFLCMAFAMISIFSTSCVCLSDRQVTDLQKSAQASSDEALTYYPPSTHRDAIVHNQQAIGTSLGLPLSPTPPAVTPAQASP